MGKFRTCYGAVYILENQKARRVKVGMTINDVNKRLGDVNDKWLGFKATCQVCGARRLIKGNKNFPQHNRCRGGNSLPLEKDATLAKSYLEDMRKSLSELSGTEKNSATRIIRTLEKRIKLYQHYKEPVGVWQFSTAFYTECSEQVELLSHKILAGYLDKKAPIGEVFCCSVSEASKAVESALRQLGLLGEARKEIRNDNTSEEHGNCAICGSYLTEKGACPECARRFVYQ